MAIQGVNRLATEAASIARFAKSTATADGGAAAKPANAAGQQAKPAATANALAKTAAAFLQEATETLAQTRQEAAAGDQQAGRLLARRTAQAAPPAEPGKLSVRA